MQHAPLLTSYMLSYFFFLREFFTYYVLPGTTRACLDFVHCTWWCFLSCPHTTTKHGPILTAYMLSFFSFVTFFFASYVLPNTICAPHDFVHVISVFSSVLIRPRNMQSWRLSLQSVTLPFLYKISTQHGHDSDEAKRDRHHNSALSNNRSGLNCLWSWSIVSEV